MAMVFCSRSLRRMFGAEADVGIRSQMENKLGAVQGSLHTVGVEKIPFDQSESSVVQRAAEEFPLAGGKVIVPGHFVAKPQQAVCQGAADKARASRH